MKKIGKKIIRRSLVVACALTIAGGTSVYFMRRSQNETIATMGSMNQNTPVIVLDAGHGEYS